MTRQEYRLACVARSQKLLAFHQTWPPLFQPRRRRPSPRRSPDWPVEARSDLFVGVVRSLDDLRFLSGLVPEAVLGDRLGPEDGEAYFTALGRGSRPEYEADLAALAAAYPDVPLSVFRWPASTTPGVRPLIMAAENPLPSGVKFVIPVYDDLMLAEVRAAWPDIRRIQGARTAHRERADTYRRRLAVYDAYAKHGTFATVAFVLHMPPSTVRDLYVRVSADINGRPGALLPGFDPGRHGTTCAQCQTAARAEDMCATARRYAEGRPL
jgi:hypothetical protein